MRTALDIENWPRKDHFHFFKKFDEPFFGVTVPIDCTKAFNAAKASGVSFFVWYLHKTLVAVNKIEPFRYRICDHMVYLYDKVDASATISREDGSFAFSLIGYNPNIKAFSKIAADEIERIRVTPGLFTRSFDQDNIIHFSALPWINFMSISHARSFAIRDSCPKISFGQMTIAADGKRSMPVSVHVHHALMDGLHVGQFLDCLQFELNG